MKLLSVSVVTLLALSFGGCGGGSSSSDGDTNGETSSGGTNDGGTSSGGTNNGGSSSLTPIIPFTCESTQEFGGTTYVFKLGANGSLACETTYGVPVLTFANGNGMDINQLVSVTKFTTSIGNGTYTIDVQHGTETIVASSSEYGSANCVNTYDVPTPISVYEASDLQHFDISAYQLVRTTCPDWVNEDDETDDEEVSGSFAENVTVTETSGKVSKISSYTSF
jgi:hypothetical protein